MVAALRAGSQSGRRLQRQHQERATQRLAGKRGGIATAGRPGVQSFAEEAGPPAELLRPCSLGRCQPIYLNLNKHYPLATTRPGSPVVYRPGWSIGLPADEVRHKREDQAAARIGSRSSSRPMISAT